MFADGITDDNSVEALVLSVQGQVSGIASRYRSSLPGLGREDLMSIGMTRVVVAARLNLPSNGKVVNERAYLARAARFAIMEQYRRGRGDPMARPAKISPSPLVSLDAPLSSASDLSRYDVLAFVDPVLPSRGRSFAPLYDALDTLPEIYRQAICMRFGLCGYGAHRNCEIASLLQISQSAVSSRIQCGLAMLREHTELLDLVGYGRAAS